MNVNLNNLKLFLLFLYLLFYFSYCYLYESIKRKTYSSNYQKQSGADGHRTHKLLDCKSRALPIWPLPREWVQKELNPHPGSSTEPRTRLIRHTHLMDSENFFKLPCLRVTKMDDQSHIVFYIPKMSK